MELIQSLILQNKRKKQLKTILSQAKDIISNSKSKKDRNHPIFAFVTSISNKIFYDDLFEFNKTCITFFKAKLCNFL